MTPRPGFLIAGTAVLGAAAFAFWPMRPGPIVAPAIERTSPAKRTVVALDLAAFRAPIWVAEPAPPPPAPPTQAPPPPPPLKLQLLAIVREAGPAGEAIYKAAVYDSDTDRVLVVGAGEKLGLRTVEQVDKSSLTLSDGGGKRVLALKEGTAP